MTEGLPGQKTKKERLAEIQAEFEVACSTKSQKELEEMLKSIDSMTVLELDLPKKIATIVKNLRERFGVGAR